MTPYKQAVVEDTEFLANHGHHWDTISRRLGVSIDAIQKHLREAGRTDITDRITTNDHLNDHLTHLRFTGKRNNTKENA